MNDCEALLQYLVPNQALLVNSHTIYLNSPWPRITLEDAFDLFSKTTLKTALETNTFEEILVEKIEPNLGIDTPVFLTDYPAAMASLAKLNPDNPDTAQRLELYINGVEIANGFSELNDPEEQRRRFEKEFEIIRDSNKETGPMPEKFLDDLNSMPDSAGIALGVDRLVMLLTDAKSIDTVVTFPPETL